MYGTVARLRLKPGAEARFIEIGRAFESAHIPGHVATHVYRTDADPNELYMAVIFTSKEAYQANATSPEQHARFQEMMAVLEREPEWHDGEILSAGS
ncbi:MAG TPA: antibiotic biosynthesis monooxygenase family protein [Ktedonobacterales bacterium]|nr:antibiotic biosynthesis monooxygenase family protein [Ktedonobacterales bacterium]